MAPLLFCVLLFGNTPLSLIYKLFQLMLSLLLLGTIRMLRLLMWLQEFASQSSESTFGSAPYVGSASGSGALTGTTESSTSDCTRLG